MKFFRETGCFAVGTIFAFPPKHVNVTQGFKTSSYRYKIFLFEILKLVKDGNERKSLKYTLYLIRQKFDSEILMLLRVIETFFGD